MSSYKRLELLHGDNGDLLLRAGVGVAIADFADYLDSNNYFLPFGECNSVHLGGHVQTGGYGHIGRIFGGLLDYVHGFEIFCTRQYVSNTSNPDVHWAVLGGSPGSFGVITYYDLLPLRNADFATSSAYKCYWYYDEETLRQLLSAFHDLLTNADDIDVHYNFGLRVVSMNRNFIQFEGSVCFSR